MFFNLPEEFLKQVEKPAQYTGNEINCIVKDSKEVELRFAFAFPDLYEIGMSYMGLQIIYNIMNNIEGVTCERVFAPATDMEKIMRNADFPLFTLETKNSYRKHRHFGVHASIRNVVHEYTQYA